MIALGVTRVDAPLPEACAGMREGALCLVAAPETDARARLALQLECHRINTAFLPVSARFDTGTEAAQIWLSRHGAALSAALDQIAGQTQLTLYFGANSCSAPRTESGADWLYRRARAVEQRQTLADVLDAQRKTRGTKHHRVQAHSAGLSLHLLIPVKTISAEAADWHNALTPRIAPHWHMVLSGGWPPLAFGPDGMA